KLSDKVAPFGPARPLTGLASGRSLSVMILDLLRHGEAVAAGSGLDRDRPLSAAGMMSLHRLRRQLLETGWRPGRAFTSPYRRAMESAAILLQDLPTTIPPETLAELAPEGQPDE